MLERRPTHGYEIRQLLSPMTSFVGAASYGSVYPMLRQLEKRGHIAATPAESAGGPERIAYRVTAAGKRRLHDLFAEAKTPFTLKLLFFDRIPMRARLQILRAQRARWANELARRREATGAAGEGVSSHYRHALLERIFGQLQRDLSWIDQLIAEGERK